MFNCQLLYSMILQDFLGFLVQKHLISWPEKMTFSLVAIETYHLVRYNHSEIRMLIYMKSHCPLMYCVR